MAKDTTVVSQSKGKETHSLFDILRRLEQYSLVEKTTGGIPPEMITVVGQLHYMEIMLKHSFLTTLPLLITAPLGFAVIQKYLPVFGKDEITLTDEIFVLALSGIAALATVIFLSVMFSMLYHGRIVRRVLNSMTQGVLLGKFLGTLICFAVFHGVYYLVIRKRETYDTIYQILGGKTGLKVATFVHNMGEAFVQASWFVVGLFILSVILIFTGRWIGSRKTRQYDVLRQKWNLY